MGDDWRSDQSFIARRNEMRLGWLDKLVGDQTSGCESPIEALLEDAFRLMPIPRGCRPRPDCSIAHVALMFPNTAWPNWQDEPKFADEKYVIILEQVEIGEFRVDFLIVAKLAGIVRRIVIECDGHDFHERTKEQAERDRSRDRWFVSNGMTVLRFTGREIWRDPIACTKEISALLFQWDEAQTK